MINNDVENEKNEDKEYNFFEDMGLKRDLLRGIYAIGFEIPSHIQKKGIVAISKRRDVLAQAQSGTGKTAAFTVGSLQLIDENLQRTQSAIIEPTRELAQQTFRVIQDIAQFMNVRVALYIGGTRMERRANPQVVVATPGRLTHMIRDRYIDMSTVITLCVDEADEMLRQGFRSEIRTIVNHISKEANVCLFSATMSQEALDMSRKFLNNPLRILVKAEEVTLEGIQQYYLNVEHENNKLDSVIDILRGSNKRTIVFVKSRSRVDQIIDQLQDALDSNTDGIVVASTHSGMSMNERRRRIEDFRNGKITTLVTTDLLARGIDVQQVSLVINFDLPLHKEDYVHRIGRSGRFGRKGLAISLVTDQDVKDISHLSIFYETEILPLPYDFKDALLKD